MDSDLEKLGDQLAEALEALSRSMPNGGMCWCRDDDEPHTCNCGDAYEALQAWQSRRKEG